MVAGGLETAALQVDSACDTRAQPGAVAAAPARPHDRAMIATGFQERRMIARGGFGEVWEALQSRLQRMVAMKRMRRDLGPKVGPDLERALLAEFRQEALTAAYLEHPNIVPVYDYGVTEAGEHILAMKYVRGTVWEAALQAEARTMAREEYLTKHLGILLDVCQAVAFAHSRGIIHRDLKPAQVVLGEFGETVLMDWGLAVRVGQATEPERDPAAHTPDSAAEVFATAVQPLPTATNPAGTPAYMAPEQTEERMDRIHFWTDVYLLGGILFRILTGQPPHAAAKSDQAFLKAASGVVPDPRAVPGVPPVPEELASLCEHAMRTRGADRIPSVKDFIARLNDFLSGSTKRRESIAATTKLREEIVAGRYNSYRGFAEALSRVGEAVALWPANEDAAQLRESILQRYADAALRAGDLTLAKAQAELLADAAEGARIVAQANAAAIRAERQRRAVKLAAATILLLLVGIIGGIAWYTRTIDRERQLAEAERDRAEAAERNAAAEKNLALDRLHYSNILLAQQLMNKQRFAQARDILWSIPPEARLWEWSLAIDRAYQALHTFPWVAAAFPRAADRALVVAREGPPRIESRSLIDGSLLAEYRGGAGALSEVAYAVQDTIVTAMDAEGTVLVWDERTGALKTILPAEGDAKRHAYAISPKGTYIATADTANGGAIHRTEDGSTVRIWDSGGPNQVFSLTFSPDEKLLSWCSAEHAYLSEVETGAVVRQQRAVHDIQTTSRFSPDGRYVYWFPARQGGHRVDIVSGHERPLSELGGVVRQLSFREEVAEVFYFGDQGQGWIAPLDTVAPRVSLIATTEPELSIWQPQGELLLTAGGAKAELWTSWNGERRATLEGHSARIFAIAIAPDETRAYTSSVDGTTCVWDAKNASLHPAFNDQVPSFHEDGRMVVSIGHSNANIWSAETGMLLYPAGPMFNLYRGLAHSADGRHVVTHGFKGDGVLSIETRGTEPNSEVILSQWPELGYRPFAWVSEDTKRIGLLAGDGNAVRYFDNRTRELWRVSPETPKALAAFEETEGGMKALLADVGRNLVYCDLESTSALWMTESKAPLRRMQELESGKEFLTIDTQGRVELRSLEDGGVLREYFDPDNPAAYMFNDPAGIRLLTAPSFGRATIWNLATGERMLSFDKGAYPFASVAFLNEGRRLAVVSGAQLRVWDLGADREVHSEAGVASISADGRYIMRENGPNRFSAVRIYDWASLELPGERSLEERDRFALWLLDRYRTVLERELRRRVPFPAGAEERIRNAQGEDELLEACSIVATEMTHGEELSEKNAEFRDLAVRIFAPYMAKAVEARQWDGGGIPAHQLPRMRDFVARNRDALHPATKTELAKRLYFLVTTQTGTVGGGVPAAVGNLPIAADIARMLGQPELMEVCLRYSLLDKTIHGERTDELLALAKTWGVELSVDLPEDMVRYSKDLIAARFAAEAILHPERAPALREESNRLWKEAFHDAVLRSGFEDWRNYGAKLTAEVIRTAEPLEDVRSAALQAIRLRREVVLGTADIEEALRMHLARYAALEPPPVSVLPLATE